MYTSTPHRVTGYAPYRLMYGRDPAIPLDQLLYRRQEDWDQYYVLAQADALTRMNDILEVSVKKAAEYNKSGYNCK